ncbi:hypothetical protein BX666DRAFT_2088575 [Dichotomocladium elegans]|nr:hypothetical protein BX666DRAFT_2088575 [Dichotomocladium elegans]
MNYTRTLSSSSNSSAILTPSRRHRGGNDNVVRAISPEGRRYLKPVNGIQTKGFARSAQRRGSVLTLGPIERLQHFYAKRDLNVNKGGILGFKKMNSEVNDDEDEDEDMLPEPPAPRPSWTDLDVETDLDVLLSHSFNDIQLTLTAWSMVTLSSGRSESDASSDSEGSGYHIPSLVHSVTRTIESVRNYTLHRSDLPDSALAKLRHASIQLLSIMRELETRHHHDGADCMSFDDLACERDAILRYLETVEEYAFNPPHHIGAPPTTFTSEIRALMHKNSNTQVAPSRPALPDWLNPACYVNDSLGNYPQIVNLCFCMPNS